MILNLPQKLLWIKRKKIIIRLTEITQCIFFKWHPMQPSYSVFVIRHILCHLTRQLFALQKKWSIALRSWQCHCRKISRWRSDVKIDGNLIEVSYQVGTPLKKKLMSCFFPWKTIVNGNKFSTSIVMKNNDTSQGGMRKVDRNYTTPRRLPP